MTLAWALVFLVVAGPRAPALAATAAPPLVHYPPDRLVVTGAGRLHVVAEHPGRATARMEVHLNGTSAEAGPAPASGRGRPLLHAVATLSPGLNGLEIRFVVDGRVADSVQRSVFFLSPLARDREPPAGFSRQAFHRSDGNGACDGCHQLTPVASDMAPGAPGASTCFSCHAALTRGREVHGPAAQWACTRCHDPGAMPRYATPDPVLPLCFSCHAEQKDRLDTSPFQHGPTATGQCTICHNPHATDVTFLLKKAPWDLCTTCHAEKGTGRHVITWGPTGQGHPTRGRPDPTRPGQELSCASCHNPHAAPAPRLWNFRATVWLDLCRNCHRTIVGR